MRAAGNFIPMKTAKQPPKTAVVEAVRRKK